MPEYNLLRKFIVLAFAFLVFATVYAVSGQSFTFGFWGKVVTININTKREILIYMGIMLMITLVYLELLILRDHLWIIEGSSQELRRWRDTFFTKESISRLKVRKMVVVIFSTIIFTLVYMRTKGTEIYSFLGIVLMITVLYFEMLSMRDDLKTLCDAFKAKEIEESLRNQLKPVKGSDSEETRDDDLLPKED